MVEEVLPDLYRIEVPLPDNPLKILNSYVIKGDRRFLIIDTGLNREECLNTMMVALRELQVDLNKADFFITHMHADHSGLVGRLATSTSIVYFNRIEFSAMPSDKRWQDLYSFFISNGFPHDEFMKAKKSHPGYRYGSNNDVCFRFLEDGDLLEIGNYSFRCVETPGHSPCHLCLYEDTNKILIAGDHILIDITPNIVYWPELHDSLTYYLASLEKVYSLDVNIVLPGHRRIWNNHRQRIRELREHHRARLNEVVCALQDGNKTAFQVAPYIKWDIPYHSWEQFPPAQKWFAFGETIAHLYHLEEKKKVNRRMKDGTVVFSLS